MAAANGKGRIRADRVVELARLVASLACWRVTSAQTRIARYVFEARLRAVGCLRGHRAVAFQLRWLLRAAKTRRSEPGAMQMASRFGDLSAHREKKNAHIQINLATRASAAGGTRAHKRRRRPRAPHPEDRDAGNSRSDHRSETAAKQQPRACAPLPSGRGGTAHMRVDEDANTRAHAGALPEEPPPELNATARRPRRASKPHLAMRARALVTRVRMSDTTSRASSTTRSVLIHPLPFAVAMATQICRRDCNQPGRASGIINPTGLGTRPPIRRSRARAACGPPADVAPCS